MSNLRRPSPTLRFSFAIVLFLTVFGVHAPINAAELNLAKPDQHPYVDPAAGREGRRLAGAEVNSARVYNFYQRQADYYMANGVPDGPLPAYPGLDAGLHGHWGKYNQNNHTDGRWNEIDHGPVLAHVFRAQDVKVLKGICVKLGAGAELSSCFDTLTLSTRAVWTDGFVSFQPFRWGCARNAELAGRPWFVEKSAAPGWEKIVSERKRKPGGNSGKKTEPENAASRYLGNARDGRFVTFRYLIGEGKESHEVHETPDAFSLAGGRVFSRRFLFAGLPKDGMPAARVRLGELPGGAHVHTTAGRVVSEQGVSFLELPKQRPHFGHLVVSVWRGPDKPADLDAQLAAAAGREPPVFNKRKTPEWPSATVKGTLGQDENGDAAYLVDTIPVPVDNPHKMVMQLTGIAFFPNGDALVSVLAGEVWHVSGLDDTLGKVTWRRYATGFNQPIGVRIDPDGIFVLDRGMITRLHDTDGNGEADFYENIANDFGGYSNSHTHTFGLARTSDGHFHFVQREGFFRTDPITHRTRETAYGLRNCMGVGDARGDHVYIAPQEGTWTPASMIIETFEGEFYGLNKRAGEPTIARPLCFVPRGIDNSTGGMLDITSNDWGPFEGRMVGLSYGNGTHYLILRDTESGERAQGAVVPLEGEFEAGVIRGAFHPVDGQLYAAGLDGWGDYSLKDGCLHRVRYTGKKVYKPSGFAVFYNGIRVDFTEPLDPKGFKPDHVFAQRWNYEYSKRYGSPEFSISQPDSLGHDVEPVRSVTLLNDGRSLFIEMPNLEPAMQMHLRMHLKAADGTAFKTDLFPSIMQLGTVFELADGGKLPLNKLTAIDMRRTSSKKAKLHSVSGELVEGAREIVLEVAGGLQFKDLELEAKAGEAVSLKLVNGDVMPHNFVLAKPGSWQKVGEASFKMLNDPKAADKHYVPELPEVLAYTHIVQPKGSHLLHFRVPETPGDYPYLCTFPGHWQAMKGVLRVR